MLKSLHKDGNIVPDSIYNLDETGLNTNTIGKNVFVDPKSKDAYLNLNGGKSNVPSVILCVSSWETFTTICRI